ncbi:MULTISPECIES: carbohydrate ABC transporter permease [Microbacterium]|uniref:Sugar ABC transporter permease n=1 Tax=Microbacterium commune TaxID=2762219 RepID=A0ABR8W4S4_9MICO|nr:MULTISPECIES: sugar ABC transporter permease [Microbacterium]MBD8011816.1 sugar ABC transporter permease [Microbacterium commune]OIU88495.1 ABC transporter permease [Microbacterium sp. AR7-10]
MSSTTGRAARTELTFRQKVSRLDHTFSPYLYIAPFFILFALIGVFPIVYTFNVSLYDWHLLKGQGDFVGLQNYVDVLNDPFFWNAFGNTFSIFLLSAIPQLVIATVVAALLNQAIRGRTFWRMSILLPYIVAPVAVTVIFLQVFNQYHGPVAGLLELLGLDPIRWSFDVFPSHVAIATMVNWRWTGYNALLLLAAMQAVPRDMYESATIDGASRLRQFWSITLPLIRPTLIFVVITATIGGLQIFTEPKLFDGRTYGGSDRQFQTIVLYLYQLGFPMRDFGRASATAWILFLVIMLVGLLSFMITRAIRTADEKTSTVRKTRVPSRKQTPVPAHTQQGAS